MLKKNWFKILISCLLTLSPIAFGLIMWDKLPETMATHWGTSGDADGFSSRTFAVFGLPLILLALNIICITTSFFDKKNKGTKVQNIAYYIVPGISIFTGAMMYLAAFEIAWNFIAIIPVLLGLLFIAMGNLMPKVRQNSTLGFKFKWTLKSEENWNATHRFGGKVMAVAGLLVILTVFLPSVAMLLTSMIILLCSVLICVIYSYNYYKKEVKNGKTDFEHICPKYSKISKIITFTVLPIILIGISIIMFTGNVTIAYTDNGFTVDSEYCDALTVDYDSIDNVEIFENAKIGTKEYGFNSAKLSLGRFKNKHFGVHTRYTYNSCKTIVAVESDGKTLIINQKDDDATREVYLKILDEVSLENGN
ncbi:MAG: SdpI family protein [Clostridia bacterium]|nr:SdpI family protein [Clostridia bacterium]